MVNGICLSWSKHGDSRDVRPNKTDARLSGKLEEDTEE